MKKLIKQSKSILLLTLLFSATMGYAQLNAVDGHNCDGSGGPEWLDANAILDSDPGNVNGSSNLEKFWGGTYGNLFVLAMERESKGNAFFAFYLNVDCNATNNDVSKGGADIALLFNVNNGIIQDFRIWAWNTTSSTYVAGTDLFVGALGNSVCNDGTTEEEFLEVGINLGDIFDLCSVNGVVPCGSITATFSLTHAGGSVSSAVKDNFMINSALPVNLPPDAEFSATDSVACLGETLMLNGSNSLNGDEGNGTGDFIQSFEWDLDYNGTFSVDHTGQNAPVTLNTYGLHQVALIVTDAFNCKDTVVSAINVYGRPVANGTMSFTNGAGPVCAIANYNGTASVDNHGTNNLTYDWNFGDGNSSGLVTGAHNYVGCNVYNGMFSVVDPDNHAKCAADTMLFLAALPVELIRFDAIVNQASKAQLTWSTASEQNNRGFYILRSINGIDWDEVGFVNGNGTTNEIQSYTWTDAIGGKGQKIYYRLKQEDFNGTTTLSVTRSITGQKTVNPVVYPNPVESKLNINIGVIEESQTVKVDVVNQMGQSVISENYIGVSEVSMSVKTLAAGIYFAKVNINGVIFTHKFHKK